ncbi:hypothetical protein MSBR3_3289 [Methanosarcina barkeri 3]|uniref:Uncharacterized protein n=1 Tax=Methanosarcina barkeri 3 TaxID=1434107 RepID=A0A0E3SPV7_METBA|nr:hypothetical protein [Methanosarcina barkeri]AKB83867.1 hypothetical protein MSBR3_3289 [Methanosarcina barkeri 3]
MTITIEGEAFPLEVINANGGGGDKEDKGFGASGQIPYPPDDPSTSTGPAVQIYDPVTKSYSDYKGK